MNKWLPVLVVLAGLGGTISCKHSAPAVSKKPANASPSPAGPIVRIGQPSQVLNPFDRYLEVAKRNWVEPSLAHFASDCQIDTGDYFRIFFCVESQRITSVESVSWKTRLGEDDSKLSGWGFEQRWKLGQDGISIAPFYRSARASDC